MNPREIVTAYAEAKCRADAAGAMQLCAPDVLIETYAFQIHGHDRDEAQRQAEGLFAIFPDYDVEVDGVVEQGDVVVMWGHLSGTMRGSLGSIEATNRSFRVPFSCTWQVRDGLIAWERIYYDLRDVCEQLGVSTDAFSAELRAIRPLLEPSAAPAAATAG